MMENRAATTKLYFFQPKSTAILSIGGQQTFSLKGQIVNILGFVGDTVTCLNYSMLSLQSKAAIGNT